MEKIRLKNGTEYNILACTTDSITIPIASTSELATIYETMTDDNLSEFMVYTDGDELCAIVLHKRVTSAMLQPTDNGYNATFNLANVDYTEQRLSALESTVDTLILENLGV